MIDFKLLRVANQARKYGRSMLLWIAVYRKATGPFTCLLHISQGISIEKTKFVFKGTSSLC